MVRSTYIFLLTIFHLTGPAIASSFVTGYFVVFYITYYGGVVLWFDYGNDENPKQSPKIIVKHVELVATEISCLIWLIAILSVQDDMIKAQILMIFIFVSTHAFTNYPFLLLGTLFFTTLFLHCMEYALPSHLFFTYSFQWHLS